MAISGTSNSVARGSGVLLLRSTLLYVPWELSTALLRGVLGFARSTPGWWTRLLVFAFLERETVRACIVGRLPGGSIAVQDTGQVEICAGEVKGDGG